jgi:hypothetical protein
MLHTVDELGTVDALAASLDHLAAQGARGAMVLGCVANDWPADGVRAALRGSSLVCFGALFPGVLHDGRVLRRGAVVLGLREAPAVAWVTAPRDDLSALQGARGLFAFCDAGASVEALLEPLYDALGPGPACIGGGGGSLDVPAPTPLVTPDGLRGGGLVVAGVPHDLRVASAHGWTAMGDELCVTRARGDVLHELNWQPAQAVYRRALDGLGAPVDDPRDFYRVASRYPLLLQDVTGATLVRDPLQALPGGALRCAGEVDEHTMLRVGRSDASAMLSAAFATADALSPGFDAGADALLTLCCVSRDLLLGSRLGLELNALRLRGAPQVGALTIGEVVGDGASMMRVHNKCVALAAWPDGRPR